MGISCRVNDRIVQVASRLVPPGCKAPFVCVGKNAAVLPAITICNEVYILQRDMIESGVNQDIFCFGIASGETFGNLSFGNELIASGIASSEAFGLPSTKFGIFASSINSSEAFGTALLNFGLTGSGIASAEAFGDATVFLGTGLSPTGIPSAEAFGDPDIDFAITATGIASAEAFGNATIQEMATIKLDFSQADNSQYLAIV